MRDAIAILKEWFVSLVFGSAVPPIADVPVEPVSKESSGSVASPSLTKRDPLKKDVAAIAADVLGCFDQIRSGELSGVAAQDTKESLELLFGCDFHLIHDIAERMEGASKFYLIGDSASDQMESVWPVDVATVVRHEGSYFLTRVFSVSPRDLRGKVKIVPRYCLKVAFARIYDDGEWWAENDICGLVGGEWLSISQPRTVRHTGRGRVIRDHLSSPKVLGELRQTIALSLSAALTARYSWHVAFGEESSGPRLVLPTNPRGCLALFNDREKRDGADRRSALRHWVSEHYRQTGDDTAYVRNHLRGTNNRFLWRDLQSELMVSAFDIEKNEFFRTQASEWRANRKHNRVRVKLKVA